MMIRRLDPRADAPLFTAMFGWLEDAPQWRRDAESVFGTLDLEDYLLAAYTPGRLDIGVFDRDEFCAALVLHLRGPGIYEVHLEAKRGTPSEIIELAGVQARDQMFDYGMQYAFTWAPDFNAAVHHIQKAIGFRPNGVTMWRGATHGRLIEWKMLELRRPNGRQ